MHVCIVACPFTAAFGSSMCPRWQQGILPVTSVMCDGPFAIIHSKLHNTILIVTLPPFKRIQMLYSYEMEAARASTVYVSYYVVDTCIYLFCKKQSVLILTMYLGFGSHAGCNSTHTSKKFPTLGTSVGSMSDSISLCVLGKGRGSLLPLKFPRPRPL